MLAPGVSEAAYLLAVFLVKFEQFDSES
jgi:hypothetical protein